MAGEEKIVNGNSHEEIYETTNDTGFDNSLNLVTRSIGKVRDSPASVDENFVVERVDELGENGESG